MRIKILLAFFGFLIFQQAFADWGLYTADRSYAIFDVKGSNNTRSVWDNGVGNIQNYDFGTFITDNIFQIDGYDVKTWKNGGSDVTGGTFKYVIYPKGNRPSSPVFESKTLVFLADLGSGNQKWGFSGANIDLLNGLSSDEYTLEFFCEVYGNNPSATIYDNNSGANYTSHFRFNYFRSDGDGAWSNASNWVDDILPSSGVDIEINSNINVDGSISCNNLIVNNSRVLTINSSHSLTVNGTLTNNAALGIVLQSPSNHGAPGSLITNGILAGSGTLKAERYIQAYTSATDGWHLISSPVNTPVISSQTNLAPGTGDDFYAWNEVAYEWTNYKPGNVFTNMGNGIGYLVSYQTAATKYFTGTPNNAAVTFSNLSRTLGYGNGWHLVGNPFPCAITWDKTGAGFNLINIAGVAKVMNNNGSYSDRAANTIIPAMQGFFVQVVVHNSNSFNIPLLSRTHDNSSWLKSGNEERFMLIANDVETSMFQESVISVNAQATEGYDYQFDSQFWAWYAPQFYSIAGDIKLSTNTLPSLPDDAIIPFGFVKNEATQFNITMQEQISGYIVYLNDLLTGVEHNLTDQPVLQLYLGRRG